MGARRVDLRTLGASAAASSVIRPGGDQATPTPAARVGRDEAPPITNVGGRWELNWRLSDKLPEKPAHRGVASPVTPPAGGGIRVVVAGPREAACPAAAAWAATAAVGARAAAASEGRATAEQVRAFLQSQRTLVIVEHADHVSITDENGQVQKLVTNGEKVKDEREGESFERRTRWDGRTLVTEIALSDGVRITQTYQKVAEGLQLVITTKLENSKFSGPREFKRVYDQALQ